MQILEEEDEFKFDFDILDPTKVWPEEDVPVRWIGKMTLNRNPDNFFAETEQVAFCPGNVVRGIDFSNDSLLQGRLFSYIDTQLIRLGGPNFHEIPINRPLAPIANNQREGYHRMEINKGKTSYFPNTAGKNLPSPASAEEGGYVHSMEKVEGKKICARSEKFKDFFSQERSEHTVKDTIKTRKVAILAANGYNHKDVSQVMQALVAGGAKADIISNHQGMLKSSSGEELEVDKSFVTTASVLYDAVYIPGGKENIEALKMQGDAIHFVNEAFRHCKPLGATGAGVELFKIANLPDIKYAGKKSAD